MLAALEGRAVAFRDLPVILITAASLPEELDSQQRRTLQVSTRRPLTADELSAAPFRHPRRYSAACSSRRRRVNADRRAF